VKITVPFQPMAELTITFLGTGTSQGVPVIGCGCPVCSSSDPRDNRTRSSIHVQSPECSWVIDTGTDFRAQCLREKITSLDAVVYTHAHTDHIMGFDDLRSFCATGRPIPIHASEPTMRSLRRVFDFAFSGENRFPGYVVPEPHEISGPFRLGDTELLALPVPHGRTTVNGYLMSRGGERMAAYLSDCKEVPAAVVDAIAGVRVLILDALRHRLHPTHLSVGEALEVVSRVKPLRTYFTHACHELPHAETDAGLPENVRLAYDGLRVEA
jgi:phosphoribosyl 1,2-cyclic phosphate phosphodiesterase